jgi:transcriptional regulator GlxA family with amidase domain
MLSRYRLFAERLISEEREDAHIGNKKVARVIDYIQANTGANIGLVAMARMAGVSPNHFVLLFTRATGLTPHQYVLRARIDSAKLHLKDEALSIAEVSRLTGFRTQEHFTKVFRKIVGVTPREFRSAI